MKTMPFSLVLFVVLLAAVSGKEKGNPNKPNELTLSKMNKGEYDMLQWYCARLPTAKKSRLCAVHDIHYVKELARVVKSNEKSKALPQKMPRVSALFAMPGAPDQEEVMEEYDTCLQVWCSSKGDGRDTDFCRAETGSKKGGATAARAGGASEDLGSTEEAAENYFSKPKMQCGGGAQGRARRPRWHRTAHRVG